MCFENLPIEFDENGKAHLKEGVKNPYTYATQTVEEREQVLADIAKKNGHSCCRGTGLSYHGKS